MKPGATQYAEAMDAAVQVCMSMLVNMCRFFSVCSQRSALQCKWLFCWLVHKCHGVCVCVCVPSQTGNMDSLLSLYELSKTDGVIDGGSLIGQVIRAKSMLGKVSFTAGLGAAT
jgi:hypothetical protein